MSKPFCLKKEQKAREQRANRFLIRSPYEGLVLWGIVLPILIVAVTFLAAELIMLPVALIFGWL